MKITHVLLRWYRSFNINYGSYDDRRHGVINRPWNKISAEHDQDYRFIEIPIQKDITTIVGGNESGKSHLVSAINKVINGVSIPDADDKQKPFHFTDLCHYAGEQKKNIDTWPNIGLRFECSQAEFDRIVDAAGKSGSLYGGSFSIVLDQKQDHVALLFIDENQPIPLTKKQLDSVRKLLPNVEFIRSTRPMSDEIEIDDLLAALSNQAPKAKSYFPFSLAQEGLNFLATLKFAKDAQLSADDIRPLSEFQAKIEKARQEHRAKVELELQLIRDVLRIETSTLEQIAELPKTGRSFVDGLMSVWNDELERELNLSHFWQQDDAFRLRLNYKAGVFYFEITDKTGAIYTFRERSSGLRYFLSYYIQAKAIEARAIKEGRTNCVLLMDEPDSFLSIVGQRNLLNVFESLVFQSKLKQGIQLIYTTHSPFLINKNFPQRIRLVRKGDGEEGTQYVGESRVRRYEPVRSALGVDCAQTLFMGEANVIVEGPTDHFIFSELTRLFSTFKNSENLLDLNSIVLMSADSAPGVEKILTASRWADEEMPATVVVFDNDDEGKLQRDRVTGNSKKTRGQKKLIDERFVITVNELLSETSETQLIITTEDLIPTRIYLLAVKNYLLKWYSEIEVPADTRNKILDVKPGANGVVQEVANFFATNVHLGSAYDKMGVFQEVVELLREYFERSNSTLYEDDVTSLQSRLIAFSMTLKRKIELSRREAKSASTARSIKRAIDDFFKRFKHSCNSFDLQLLLERCSSLAKFIGEDARQLAEATDALLEKVHAIRKADVSVLTDKSWIEWNTALNRIRENPLNPNALDSLLESQTDELLETATKDGLATESLKKSPLAPEAETPVLG